MKTKYNSRTTINKERSNPNSKNTINNYNY